MEKKNFVTTLRFNEPKKLNGWTLPMMEALYSSLSFLASSDCTKAVILTGSDPYFSAGAQLNSLIKLMPPKAMFEMIRDKNARLFNLYLDFPKPIIAAINGPTIGAAVTSSTLCDAIIASEKATFSTPFAKLHIPPEGCSSVHFARLMGEENANRILGPENWVPTGKEAAEIGLATAVVEHESLLSHSQDLAEKWIKEGKKREIMGGGDLEEYKRVNLEESTRLAEAFLSKEFLMHQYNFLKSKGKTQPALMMGAVALTRPLWSKFM